MRPSDAHDETFQQFLSSIGVTAEAMAATREGTIHIFHQDSPDKVSVVETVKTEFGAKTMAHDPKTHNLYVDTSDFGPPPQPNAQPVAKPGTFRVLIYGPSR